MHNGLGCRLAGTKVQVQETGLATVEDLNDTQSPDVSRIESATDSEHCCSHPSLRLEKRSSIPIQGEIRVALDVTLPMWCYIMITWTSGKCLVTKYEEELRHRHTIEWYLAALSRTGEVSYS